MAKIKKKIILFLCISGLSLIWISCANQLPPGGGEIDYTPPEIVESFPESGTINFNENYFELTFSEYVEKRSVQDAIFISPNIEGKLELNWSGKSVRVYFPEKLRENTTYVVTIGTDVVDYNNKNRMAESFTFIFSTGPEIHKKIISGTVFDPKPEGVLIFAYEAARDTINPLENKPDYISQTGSKGNFKLLGLKAGGYRVFAVRDEFRDLLLQPDQDEFGAPFTDVTLAEEDTIFQNLNFFLSSADTLPPRILSASMTDRHHILVNLSRPGFDSTIIRSDNFFLYDSTAGNKINALYSYKGNTKPGEFVVVVDTVLQIEKEVYFFADTLKDARGNIYTDDYASLTISDKPDTTKPGIFKAAPRGDVDYQNAGFSFYFDDAFDSTEAVKGIAFKDSSGKNIPHSVSFYDDASFKINPLSKLEPKQHYVITFHLNRFIDAAGNFHDSTYKFQFTTITGLDFTGASGTMTNIDPSRNIIVILQSTERDKSYVYQQHLNKNRSFDFKRIEPGSYKLWAYVDEDSSGTYNYGWPFPFEPAEEFSYHADTLNLRARWSQTDIIFPFKVE